MKSSRLALTLSFTFVVGCGESQADNLSSTTQSYSTSLDSATTYIKDELADYRTTFREDRLNGRMNQLRFQLRSDPDTALTSWKQPPDGEFLLCVPQRYRVQYDAALVPLASVGRTTGRLTAKSKSTGLALIIETFARDYEASPPATESDESDETAMNACKQDLEDAAQLLNGTTEYGQREAAVLATAVAVLELADTMYKAFVAVGEKVASAVDERRRRAVLVEFLENPDTQKAFKEATERLREGLVLKSRSRRLVVAQNYLLLYGDLQQRWSTLASLPEKERTTPEAVDEAVFAKLQPLATRVAALGEQYDAEFDKRALPGLALVEKSFEEMVKAAKDENFDSAAAVALFEDVKEIFDALAKQREALIAGASKYREALGTSP